MESTAPDAFTLADAQELLERPDTLAELARAPRAAEPFVAAVDRAFSEAVAGFDEMEVLHTYPFTPNQCVLFVKTFNSWHSVAPMRGPAGKLRRTLTINIEALA